MGVSQGLLDEEILLPGLGGPNVISRVFMEEGRGRFDYSRGESNVITETTM